MAGKSQKTKDTQAELSLRFELEQLGLAEFLTHKTIPLPSWAGKNQRTTPDVLFPDDNLAVFVDGCYWHGCPKHYPRGSESWRSKVAKQRVRDQRHSRCLETLGYRVFRIWECEAAEKGAKAIQSIIETSAPTGTYGLPQDVT
jgi:DNA mismatch endonuclease (patch repair protein)